MQTTNGADMARIGVIVLNELGLNTIGCKGSAVPHLAEPPSIIPEPPGGQEQDTGEGCFFDYHEERFFLWNGPAFVAGISDKLDGAGTLQARPTV